ncbi:hypothetical protein ACROYT_G003096 [Oculina patagonica]
MCFTNVVKTFDNPTRDAADDLFGISTTRQEDRPLIVQLLLLHKPRPEKINSIITKKDWDSVKFIRESVSLPLILDVGSSTLWEIDKCIEYTGVHGVAVSGSFEDFTVGSEGWQSRQRISGNRFSQSENDMSEEADKAGDKATDGTLVIKCMVKGYHACDFTVEVGEEFVAKRKRGETWEDFAALLNLLQVTHPHLPEKFVYIYYPPCIDCMSVQLATLYRGTDQ